MPRLTVLMLAACLFAQAGCGAAGSDESSSKVPSADPTPTASISEGESPADADTDLTNETKAVGETAQREAAAHDAFAALLAAHRDGKPEAWSAADARLTELGKSALPAFVMGLQSEQRDERELASAGLAKLGAEALAAENEMLAALDDESELVRVNVTSILSLQTAPDSSGERPRTLAEALAKLLDSSNVNTRRAAAVTLGNLGPYAEPAVPRLIELLKDDDLETRTAAANTLGRLGPIAQPAASALEAVIADDETGSELRTAAAEALDRLRDEPSKQ